MAQSRNGIPRFRSQLVRQQPTKAELATRSPIVLTVRDHAILTAVYTHGCLTVDLIELAFFPSASTTGRRSPSSRVHDRLRQLWLWASSTGWNSRSAEIRGVAHFSTRSATETSSLLRVVPPQFLALVRSFLEGHFLEFFPFHPSDCFL